MTDERGRLTLRWRVGTALDAADLARMNAHLIEDEGHANPLDVDQLAARMSAWLAGRYQAVLFLDGERIVAYALYGTTDDGWEGPAGGVYLRQFFVDRAFRRRGIGREAIDLLRREVWPRGCRVTLETLLPNTTAQLFWRAVGFRDYALTFEWRAG